jgi:hypothetical protein
VKDHVDIETYFALILNILPLSGLLASFGIVASGTSEGCGEVEDVEDAPHFFLFCPQVAGLLEALYVRLQSLVLGVAHVGLLPGGQSDGAGHCGPIGSRKCLSLRTTSGGSLSLC